MVFLLLALACKSPSAADTAPHTGAPPTPTDPTDTLIDTEDTEDTEDTDPVVDTEDTEDTAPGECTIEAFADGTAHPDAPHYIDHVSANNGAWAVGAGDALVFVHATDGRPRLATAAGSEFALPLVSEVDGALPAGCTASHAVTPVLAPTATGYAVAWVERPDGEDCPEGVEQTIGFAEGNLGDGFTVRAIARYSGHLVYPTMALPDAGPYRAVLAITDRGADPYEGNTKNDDDTLHVLGVPATGPAVELDAAFPLLDGHHAQRDPTVVGEGAVVLVLVEQECTDCCPAPPCDEAGFRDPHLFVQRSEDGGQSWLDAPVGLLADDVAVGDDPSACLRDGVAHVVWRDVGAIQIARGPALAGLERMALDVDGEVVDSLSVGRIPVVRCADSGLALVWVADSVIDDQPVTEQGLTVAYATGAESPLSLTLAQAVSPEPGRLTQSPSLAVDGDLVDVLWVDAPEDWDIDPAYRLTRRLDAVTEGGCR